MCCLARTWFSFRPFARPQSRMPKSRRHNPRFRRGGPPQTTYRRVTYTGGSEFAGFRRMSKGDPSSRLKGGTMPTGATAFENDTIETSHSTSAGNGLALARLTIGAMFVWVFFENLHKDLYTREGYAGLINYYIKASHSPAAWKAVMGFMASHAGMAAPMQAMTEIGLGILLVIGLLTRPAAFVAFLYLGSLWISEWGTAWIWELLVPVLASLGLAIGRAGRRWGVDALLSQRRPSSPWW